MNIEIVKPFYERFLSMVNENNFVLTDEEKNLIKEAFPNRTFKSGCKSCWSDAVSEIVNQIRSEEKMNAKTAELESATLFGIDEIAYKSDYMLFSFNGKRVMICKDVEKCKAQFKNRNFEFWAENSENAQKHFAANMKNLSKFLKKIE